jgi:hypothetical protein
MMLASIAERERFRAKLNNIRRDITTDAPAVPFPPSPVGEGLGVRLLPVCLMFVGEQQHINRNILKELYYDTN